MRTSKPCVDFRTTLYLIIITSWNELYTGKDLGTDLRGVLT